MPNNKKLGRFDGPITLLILAAAFSIVLLTAFFITNHPKFSPNRAATVAAVQVAQTSISGRETAIAQTATAQAKVAILGQPATPSANATIGALVSTTIPVMETIIAEKADLLDQNATLTAQLATTAATGVTTPSSIPTSTLTPTATPTRRQAETSITVVNTAISP